MDALILFAILVALPALLGVTADRFGADSRDGLWTPDTGDRARAWGP